MRPATFVVEADSQFFGKAFKNKASVSELLSDLLSTGRSRHEPVVKPGKTDTKSPARKVTITIF